MASFDDAALSKLTAKIENKLAEPKKNQGKKDQGKRKRDQTADPVQPPPNKRKNLSKPNGSKNNAKSKTQKTQKSNAAPETDSSNALLDEIRALGGDEEDLKLVEDVNSEDEGLNNEKGKKNADKGLRAELAKFAAGLGFDDVRPEPETEESDHDVDNANDIDGDEDDVESTDGSDTPGKDIAEKPIRNPKMKTVSKRLYKCKICCVNSTDVI